MKEERTLLNWQSLYDLEIQINESIGCKERFILLSSISKRMFFPTDKLNILDGGGSRATSLIMKKLFPHSFIVSANIDGVNNNVADISIKTDLAEYNIIKELSKISEFELIFLGEVFEHLFAPYSTLKNLIKLLRPNGYMIITTPNLANLYNRILLLIGKPLYNYRPLGILPHDDHITLVTVQQMVNLLNKILGLEMCAIKGYSYYEQQIGIVPESPYAKSGIKLRHIRGIANKLLPLNFKEGILYVATKP